MANLYGVSNPITAPSFVFPASPVICPAGARTPCIATPAIAAISAGIFYPVLFAYVTVTLGATPPTGLNFGIALFGGSDMQAIGTAGGLLAASATIEVQMMMFGTPSASAWQGPGSIVQLMCEPLGQQVTVQTTGTYMQVFLYRAPDQ